MCTSVKQVLRHLYLEKNAAFQIGIYLQVKDRKLGRQSDNLA